MLEVKCKDMADDRSIHIFSSYERVCYRKDDGNLIMQIYYYRFNTDDIVRNILFLGHYVKVISPACIAEKVKEQLKQVCENYKSC
ncbi:MAG: WYL domain-containing protein [Clostridiales bacterium]|nr:WYL domain-containing protein [Clostridiales bacterium]